MYNYSLDFKLFNLFVVQLKAVSLILFHTNNLLIFAIYCKDCKYLLFKSAQYNVTSYLNSV